MACPAEQIEPLLLRFIFFIFITRLLSNNNVNRQNAEQSAASFSVFKWLMDNYFSL